MTNYFTRLAQRSGIRGADPMPAAREIAGAAGSSASAPLEQNVEITAQAQRSETATARETAIPKRIETSPTSLPSQEARRPAETPQYLPAEIAPRRDQESQREAPRPVSTSLHHSPVSPQTEQRITKVQSAPDHKAGTRKISTTPPQPSARAPISAPAVELSRSAAVPKSESSRLLSEHASATTKKIEPERSAGFRETTLERPAGFQEVNTVRDDPAPAIGAAQKSARSAIANPFSEQETHSWPQGNISRGKSNSATTGGPVEIRIGTIALEVRAPQTQAPAPRPRAKPAQSDSFSPYRHYLRSW